MGEMIERVKELEIRKSKDVDAFGLTIQKLGSEDSIDQITPYDSFIFEDSLRLALNYNSLDEIKEKMKERMNKENGLYKVTVGDIRTEYYAYATMFNRLTNETYSRKIWRTVKLLRNMLNGIKRDYSDNIANTISAYNFDTTMNIEEAKRSKI